MKRQAIRSPHIPEPPPQRWSPAIRVDDRRREDDDMAKMATFLTNIKKNTEV